MLYYWLQWCIDHLKSSVQNSDGLLIYISFNFSWRLFIIYDRRKMDLV